MSHSGIVCEICTNEINNSHEEKFKESCPEFITGSDDEIINGICSTCTSNGWGYCRTCKSSFNYNKTDYDCYFPEVKKHIHLIMNLNPVILKVFPDPYEIENRNEYCKKCYNIETMKKMKSYYDRLISKMMDEREIKISKKIDKNKVINNKNHFNSMIDEIIKDVNIIKNNY